MEKLILSSLSESDIRKLVKEGVMEVLYNSDFTQNSKKETDYVDLDEACKILMKSKATVYGMTSTQKIPFYKRGKKLYFKKEELLHWLGQGRRKTVDEIRQGADDFLARKGRFPKTG
ncbi:MAG: helix-turn-helix domain-containing protein [Bacteroidia bacterium]|nr:helix-turn-helix domain-containing protein [Bacteroidia bacterium]